MDNHTRLENSWSICDDISNLFFPVPFNDYFYYYKTWHTHFQDHEEIDIFVVSYEALRKVTSGDNCCNSILDHMSRFSITIQILKEILIILFDLQKLEKQQTQVFFYKQVEFSLRSYTLCISVNQNETIAAFMKT